MQPLVSSLKIFHTMPKNTTLISYTFNFVHVRLKFFIHFPPQNTLSMTALCKRNTLIFFANASKTTQIILFGFVIPKCSKYQILLDSILISLSESFLMYPLVSKSKKCSQYQMKKCCPFCQKGQEWFRHTSRHGEGTIDKER